MSPAPAEPFKPYPVRRSDGLGTRLRMIVDLQLLTCTRYLAPRLKDWQGSVLDVGCGHMPFRHLIRAPVQYTGIDVPEAIEFGMAPHPDVVPFDGKTIPFPDASFDYVLCTEVLEHSSQPEALVAEMLRVLRPGGRMLVTIPFAARVHHAPYDYQRYTFYGLALLFRRFAEVHVKERGDDLAVLANKLIVIGVRLARPSFGMLWRLPFLALLAPVAGVALLVAHASLIWRWGSRMDPLGYGVELRKKGP